VELSPELKPRMRVNALLVIAAYQALVLVPVGISALLLFWAVGRLAVSPDVAAEWVYGDNAGERETRLVDNLSFLGEPWTRVPLVLAAFSVLYLTVTLLTTRNSGPTSSRPRARPSRSVWPSASPTTGISTTPLRPPRSTPPSRSPPGHRAPGQLAQGSTRGSSSSSARVRSTG
jgi:hypothetical protein